jgi:hypothetical protein
MFFFVLTLGIQSTVFSSWIIFQLVEKAASQQSSVRCVSYAMVDHMGNPNGSGYT